MAKRKRTKGERDSNSATTRDEDNPKNCSKLQQQHAAVASPCIDRTIVPYESLDGNRKRRCKSSDAKNMRVAPFKKDHNPSETFIRQDVELKVLPYKENAMLNELIVANLMKFASIKELARNRLVCQRWNFEATQLIKRKHVLEIVDENTRHSIAAFIDSMKHSNFMPFTRFELRFEENLPKKLPKSYRTFFFLFGGFINHLSIGFLLDCEVNFSVHVLRNVFLVSVPNIVSLAIDLPVATTSEPAIFLRDRQIRFHRLKSILIQDFIDDAEDLIEETNGRYSPGFMADLFNASPSLEKFSLFTDSNMLMTRIVKSLYTLRLNNTPLTQLHLDGQVNESDLASLNEYQFHLRAVRFRCLNSDVTKTALERFLEVHRKTLEDLCIGDRCDYGTIGEDRRRFNLKFPRMERLQRVKIIRRSCFTARQQGKFYMTAGFFHLPVLTKLTFDNDFPEPFLHLEDFFPKCDKKSLSVKEMDFSCELLDPGLLRDIAKDFPEVSKLRITHATNKLVKIICEFMINIENLWLYLPDFERGRGSNLGSMCIQLDVKNCKQICVLRSPREGYWFTVVFKKPAIGLLKKIQKLEVETRNLRNCVHDVRVLTKFNELTSLYFNRKLTDKYRRTLCNQLPHVRVIDSSI